MEDLKIIDRKNQKIKLGTTSDLVDYAEREGYEFCVIDDDEMGCSVYKNIEDWAGSRKADFLEVEFYNFSDDDREILENNFEIYRY